MRDKEKQNKAEKKWNNDHKIFTLDQLYEMRALGKITERQKQLIERMEECEREINDWRAYKPYFKDKCVLCRSEIPKEWAHYKHYGNFCGGNFRSPQCMAKFWANEKSIYYKQTITKRNYVKS